jgi:hypothetical protein
MTALINARVVAESSTIRIVFTSPLHVHKIVSDMPKKISAEQGLFMTMSLFHKN